jgi:hypothetical protein
MGAVVLNVTVTLVEELSTSVHVFAAAHPPAFVQPPKAEDAPGMAVKSTLGELTGSVRAYWPVHIPA